MGILSRLIWSFCEGKDVDDVTYEYNANRSSMKRQRNAEPAFLAVGRIQVAKPLRFMIELVA